MCMNRETPTAFPTTVFGKYYELMNNSYWIGTTRGVTKMELNARRKPRFTTYYPSEESGYSFGTVRQLLIDNNNQLWAGTSAGLYIFDSQTNSYSGYIHDPEDEFTISSNDIRAIYLDSKQQLWLGTSRGLNRYDPISNSFIRYLFDSADATSISHNIVRSIIEDKQGRLWLGTGGGLNEMIPPENRSASATFKAYTMQDGLPNETIYSMEVDDEGYIWLSTNNGLSRFDPEKREFLNFHTHQGLQSHEFNSAASLKSSGGKLLFGGINGFNFFDPNKVPHDRNNYPIVFTDFRVNYKEVAPASRHLQKHINIEKEVQLDYSKDQMFYFEFTVLDVLNASTRQFTYRLLPFEKEWNELTAINHASYTNIPPGNYTFQVKSSDKNGNLSDQTGEVQIYIKPAFWQTAWFRLGGLLLILGIAYGIYRYRVRSIVYRQTQLEQQVSERTTQIREQKKELEETLTALQNTQVKLVESAKMASLGQLTAGIAHEINNPINYINGNAEALGLDFKDLETLLQQLTKLENGTYKQGNHPEDTGAFPKTRPSLPNRRDE